MKRTIAAFLTILLLFALCGSAFAEGLTFSDMPHGAWYEQAVYWAVQKNITAGVGNGRFGPGQKVSRAQVVTMLWRLDGSKSNNGESGFSDVPAGRWYSKAVTWAVQNQIVAGYSSTVFGPGNNITRQDLVTILYRYAAYKNMSTSARADLSGYSDVGSISGYAVEPMRWAVASGIVSGTGAATLSPKRTATRAQLVQMLYKWLGPSDYELPFIPN